jgi:hypothetical protein
MIGVVGCLRCGRRQVDPASGPSPWKRGVRRGLQVLVCPECQTDGWTDLLDHCGGCGSTALVRRLGEASCRACGAVDEVVASSVDGLRDSSTGRDALAADVASAVDRVLGGNAAEGHVEG